MSGDKCVYFNCNLTRRSSNNIFHPFPANIKLHNRWIVNSGNINLEGISPKKLRKRYICSDHFDDSMYMNLTSIKPRLIQNAVPKKYSLDANVNIEKTLDTTPTKKNNNSDVTFSDSETHLCSTQIYTTPVKKIKTLQQPVKAVLNLSSKFNELDGDNKRMDFS